MASANASAVCVKWLGLVAVADIADQANDRADQFLQHSLAVAAKGGALPFKGECHNCQAELASPLRFCDHDCRDDWQRRNPSR